MKVKCVQVIPALEKDSALGALYDVRQHRLLPERILQDAASNESLVRTEMRGYTKVLLYVRR